MTEFRSRRRSVAAIPVSPEQIWDVLTDPDLLAGLAPLLDRISARGDVWTWTLVGISGLGLEVAPTFTERMTFVPISRIDYHHEPPPGSTERAGVDGSYQITMVGEHSSKLAIDVQVCIDLPIPGFGRRAVEKIMEAAMGRTGDRFARNLYRHLGVDPDDVTTKVIEGDGRS